MLTNTMVRSTDLWLKISASSLVWERRPVLRRRPRIWSKASQSCRKMTVYTCTSSIILRMCYQVSVHWQTPSYSPLVSHGKKKSCCLTQIHEKVCQPQTTLPNMQVQLVRIYNSFMLQFHYAIKEYSISECFWKGR